MSPPFLLLFLFYLKLYYFLLSCVEQTASEKPNTIQVTFLLSYEGLEKIDSYFQNIIIWLRIIHIYLLSLFRQSITYKHLRMIYQEIFLINNKSLYIKC